jgi:hypothetical protein
MGRIRNFSKKALAVAMLYLGKRVAAKVAGKVIASTRKSKPGNP